jgi:hypothetical protein
MFCDGQLRVRLILIRVLAGDRAARDFHRTRRQAEQRTLHDTLVRRLTEISVLCAVVVM